jgi:hypothetical protein
MKQPPTARLQANRVGELSAWASSLAQDRSTPSTSLPLELVCIYTPTLPRLRPAFTHLFSLFSNHSGVPLAKMPGLAYDDSGILAAYFGLTFLTFILFPATFLFFRKAVVSDEASLAAKKECSCQACREKVKQIRKAETKSIFGIQ